MKNSQDISLDPYADRIRLVAKRPCSVNEWRNGLISLMEAVARKCGNIPSAVIGHLKTIAVFPGDHYLQVSVISDRYPAETTGNIDEMLDSQRFEELEIVLNLIVHGAPKSDLEKIFSNVIDETLEIEFFPKLKDPFISNYNKQMEYNI